MTLLVSRAHINTANAATLLDVVCATSASNCDCTNTVSPTFVACSGNYNVSSDGTAPGANSQINVDFTGAFVNNDPTQGINQAWADANLVGAGWNGSDIAAWAVVDESGGAAQAINIITAQQSTEAQTLSATQLAAVHGVVAQQRSQSASVLTSHTQLINRILAEQAASSAAVTVTQRAAQQLNTTAVQQVSQAQLISTSQAQQLSAIVAEQFAQAQPVATPLVISLFSVVAEQHAAASTVAIEQLDGQLIGIVTSEQASAANTVFMTALSTVDAIASEQHTAASSMAVAQKLTFTAHAAEQLTHSQIITISLPNVALELKNLRLVPVHEPITLHSLTPDVFTLETDHDPI